MTLQLSSKQFHAHNQTAASAIMSQAVCFYVNHTFLNKLAQPLLLSGVLSPVKACDATVSIGTGCLLISQVFCFPILKS